MSKEYKKMKKKELLGLCVEREIEPVAGATKKHIVGLLERNDRVIAGTGPFAAAPELSETPVIDDEQANAPAPETDESKPDLPVPKPTRMPATVADIPVTPRPVVEKEPEPVEPVAPVICAGCKATVESDTTRACPHCTGNLVFCPTCAKPGTCHKCGKGLK